MIPRQHVPYMSALEMSITLITPLLRQLHWLRDPPRSDYFLTGDTDVPVRQRDCSDVRRVADVHGRKHPRSAAASLLAIPATRRSSIGDRVVAAASVWNKLLQDIRYATSLSVIRRQLKTHLLRPSDTFVTCRLRNLHRRWLVV